MVNFKAVMGCVLTCLSLSSLLPSAHAQPAISAAQIEQFKQLPRAQQEALAAQYGITLPSLPTGPSTPGAQPPQTDQPTVMPRPISTPTAPSTFDDGGETTKLKPYGYDLFAGKPTTF